MIMKTKTPIRDLSAAQRGRQTTAFCWANGLIGFTTPKRCPRVPKGARTICTGDDKEVRALMECCARHAYKRHPRQRQMLLVPGIPEAALMGYNPAEKLDQFRRWVRGKLSTRRAA